MTPIAAAIITVLGIVVAAYGIALRNLSIERDFLAARANAARQEARQLALDNRQLEAALASATQATNAANRRAAQAANAIRNLPPMVDAELPVGVHLGPFSVN